MQPIHGAGTGCQDQVERPCLFSEHSGQISISGANVGNTLCCKMGGIDRSQVAMALANTHICILPLKLCDWLQQCHGMRTRHGTQYGTQLPNQAVIWAIDTQTSNVGLSAGSTPFEVLFFKFYISNFIVKQLNIMGFKPHKTWNYPCFWASYIFINI